MIQIALHNIHDNHSSNEYMPLVVLMACQHIVIQQHNIVTKLVDKRNAEEMQVDTGKLVMALKQCIGFFTCCTW